MRTIRCSKCGQEGPVYIVEMTDDYVTIRCPICGHEWAICAGSDSGR